MTPEEKQVSFYNRYFIFRKNRNINAKQLKNSFLSYAGLQEEHERAMTTTTTSKGKHDRDHDDDEATEKLALEKIAKASLPIDVATKPAIAAHILTEQRDEKISALSGTMKIKPKPRLKTVKTTKAKDTTTESSSAVAPIERAPVVEEEMSAPIVQIEKKIQKRTKKTKISDTDANVSADVHESVAAVVPPKRKTKKKTDL